MSASFECLHKVSVVTAMLPSSTAGAVIDELFHVGERNAFMTNARGTLLRQHWLQRFLAPLNPEKEILRFLVPDDQVDEVLRQIVERGGLRYSGSGAVFARPCEILYHTPEFPIWAGVESEDDIQINSSLSLRENLVAISCIVEPSLTDTLSRAAMRAGAHGPIVSYCEGHGLRDRLGWLRITRQAIKERMMMVVDRADSEAVIEAMRSAGRLDMPGRGFLYREPVQKGIVSLARSAGHSQHAADMPQIIAALDEVLGHTDWRRRPVTELSGGARAAGLGLGEERSSPTVDYRKLTFIASTDHAPSLLDAALESGAAGANLMNTRLVEAESEEALGQRLNSERIWVQSVVPAAKSEAIMQAVLERASIESMTEACIFSQPVKQVVTYQARAPATDPRQQRVYRGAKIGSG